MEMLATGIDCSHLEVSPTFHSQEITFKTKFDIALPWTTFFLRLK